MVRTHELIFMLLDGVVVEFFLCAKHLCIENAFLLYNSLSTFNVVLLSFYNHFLAPLAMLTSWLLGHTIWLLRWDILGHTSTSWLLGHNIDSGFLRFSGLNYLNSLRNGILHVLLVWVLVSD